MQRYREMHDLWHLLTGCEVDVLGELAEKQFEYLQTSLPMCKMSVMGGQYTLSSDDRHLLSTVYSQWSNECHHKCTPLMTVYLENYFDQSIDSLREKFNIVVAPSRKN
jgi:ubiquinone biosynthesis protein COQ4